MVVQGLQINSKPYYVVFHHLELIFHAEKIPILNFTSRKLSVETNLNLQQWYVKQLILKFLSFIYLYSTYTTLMTSPLSDLNLKIYSAQYAPPLEARLRNLRFMSIIFMRSLHAPSYTR